MTDIIRFMAIFDTHWGFERQHGKKVPFHDQRAIDAVIKFAQDFKPTAFVFGGDIPDCGPVSHWNKHRKLAMEGLRLVDDFKGCDKNLITPIDGILPKGAQKVYITGNHEDWVNQFVDENPGLDGLLSIDQSLHLSERGWTVLPQGGVAKLGKLYFAHGDQIKGGEHVAKAAVIQYERNIRFGHHHTYQVYTKTSAVDLTEQKTGVAVPGLCNRGPGYGKKSPNRWTKGFLWGYVYPDGTFSDYVSVIIKDRFHANGKTYRA